MERSEKIGLGVAGAGHLVLFGLLSVGFLATPNPEVLKPTPISVSLVDEVGLQAAAPQSVTPPAESRAPDPGPPEDAAPPPAPQEAEPDPTPPAPEPQPAPPKPAPPKPAPPKPAPAAKPAPKAPPAPKQKPAPAAKPVKTADAAPKRAAATPAKAKPAAAKGTGSDAAATKPRPRGSRLGDDFLKGLSDQPSKSTSTVAQAARVDARALAGIQDAIRRQIQPCADRQSNAGIPPDAKDIVITFNLRLDRGGKLSSTPTIVRRTNADGGTGRYAQQIADIGLAAFKGCSPLRLPAEYYATANGGWSNINYNWQLR